MRKGSQRWVHGQQSGGKQRLGQADWFGECLVFSDVWPIKVPNKVPNYSTIWKWCRETSIYGGSSAVIDD